VSASDLDSPAPSPGLVVEQWVPPDRALDPQLCAKESVFQRPGGRLIVAFSVITLHAILAAWLLRSAKEKPPPLAADSLVLLPGLPASRRQLANSNLVTDLPPVLERVDLTLPKPTALPREPAEIALPLASASDVLVGDAAARDIEDLAVSCRSARSHPRFTDHASELTLLVHVEKDGRVSDSRIEVGSGAASIDEAVQRCLIVRGSLTPRRINGAPVASWQRVHWPSG
jgi:hypothetical protein